MGEAGGARLVARSTERLLDELPSLMACSALDEAADLAGQHVNWREFKFYFIATASRVVSVRGCWGGGGQGHCGLGNHATR